MFIVGGQYENWKGLFIVKEISGDEMLIEWDTGEKRLTSVKQQTSIIKNMEMEWEMSNSNKIKAKSLRVPASYGIEFSGLKDKDFKTNVEGTHWRSREQLGGAVAKAIIAERALINSWATYREPNIQWADKRNYKVDKAWEQAKFWVSINTKELTLGFYIEREPKLDDVRDHWNMWISWIKDKDEWLRKVAIEKNLEFFSKDGSINCFEGRLIPQEKGWSSDFLTNLRQSSAYAVFSNLPETGWIGVVLGKRFEKDIVISRAANIANDIAEVFSKLMPMYEACISKT